MAFVEGQAFRGLAAARFQSFDSVRRPSPLPRPRSAPHDVALLQDQVLGAIYFDLGARPFAEQHNVAGLDVEGDEPAPVVATTGPDCDDLALLQFLPSPRESGRIEFSGS